MKENIATGFNLKLCCPTVINLVEEATTADIPDWYGLVYSGLLDGISIAIAIVLQMSEYVYIVALPLVPIRNSAFRPFLSHCRRRLAENMQFRSPFPPNAQPDSILSLSNVI